MVLHPRSRRREAVARRWPTDPGPTRRRRPAARGRGNRGPRSSSGGGGENGACLRIRAARARRTTRPPDPCSAGPTHCMAAGSDGGSGAGASSALHRAGLGFIPSSCGSRSGPPGRGVPARRPCSVGGSLTSGSGAGASSALHRAGARLHPVVLRLEVRTALARGPSSAALLHGRLSHLRPEPAGRAVRCSAGMLDPARDGPNRGGARRPGA
ncbi:unnamed protein product [Urochloa humidicola]